MLPQFAQQHQPIMQPLQDGHHLPDVHAFASTRLQPLPYRGSRGQHASPNFAPLQRAFPVRHTIPEARTHEAQFAQATGTHNYGASEHLLRRKTPSGTLAAGYDGTPVQWSTKPPASKHILLSASCSSSRNNVSLHQESSILGRHGQLKYDPKWPPQLHTDSVDVAGGNPSTAESQDWTKLPPLLNGSHTMFDRAPMHQTPTYVIYNNAVQVPTVLQPPYQPCSGPTASNDGGFYGPYWPDGNFVPYRPAAVRHTPSNLCQPVISNSNIPSLLSDNITEYQHNSLHAGYEDSPQDLRTWYGNPEGQDQTYFSNPPDSALRGNCHLLSDNDSFHSAANRGPYTPIVAASSKNQNAQFKEKALTWAHSAYVELLANLHRSKKDIHQSRHTSLGRSYSQTSIYPKPPRQSSFTSAMQTSIEYSSQMDGKPFSSHSAPTNIARRSSHPITGQLEQSQTAAYSSAIENAKSALEMLMNLCRESEWRWIDGMLLGGCLAYGLEDYHKALEWYAKIVAIDPSHVEGISNLAATLLSLNRREEAEQYWLQSVKLRPNYFEAVEHLIGLLCGEHRGAEAVGIIEFVERSLRIVSLGSPPDPNPRVTRIKSSLAQHNQHQHQHQRHGVGHDMMDGYPFSSESTYPSAEQATFDFKRGVQNLSFGENDVTAQAGFGSSGYAIPGSENGRMLALVHAKGSLLYALGDICGAERAFEDAVLIGTGRRVQGIRGLIQKINYDLSMMGAGNSNESKSSTSKPLLLPPDKALQTARIVFPRHGELPGFGLVPEGIARNAAISTTSNTLLSLAKIFQDGMSNTQSLRNPRRPSGVGDILALYYLSLSLQPTPSTANNVGILLASVQQPVTLPAEPSKDSAHHLIIPGVVPGSGIALALAYYNYGLNLDPRHSHLYTNLGSLFKDIGQLAAAITMYEQAVACDGTFDIALANLANAVKDQGRISESIEFYKRAVKSSPNFAEAVCGLASALNSVCDWTGRGGVLLEEGRYDRWHVNNDGMLCDAEVQGATSGWIKRVINIVRKQLDEGANWGKGILQGQVMQAALRQLEIADCGDEWSMEKSQSVHARLSSWAGKTWEGTRIVWLVERAMKKAMHRWYRDKFIHRKMLPRSNYCRPQLPMMLSVPAAPTVLPFHTFTCPLSAKDIRMISQRNALRISCSTLRAPWLPESVFEPPPPPNPSLNIGYVSSDFNNHPLAHLMQSVFGLHDRSIAKAFCYATTPSDHSVHREQIEREAPVFCDSSSWSPDMLVQKIVEDKIHILVNLNGYTRGARNEVFAARPAPIQMSFMGFAGTLGAEWCDYLLADKIAIPPETLRPWRQNVSLEDQLLDDKSVEEEDWVYSENIIFCRDTFFCCDHRQSSPDAQVSWDEEQRRRWGMRKELFPLLHDDAIILGNFNQLYKIDPTTFRTWLRILAKVPRAILWLLRFPDLGESHLKRTARLWAGEEVASRIWFTDVAPKNQHIARARVCDLFLDTPECNAHTTAADVLWSSTPLLTLPRYKYKMCSRMAASILTGALPKTAQGRQAAKELIAEDENHYEQLAVKLARGLVYDPKGVGTGRLAELRKLLYKSRSTSALFDTKRWVSDLESAYQEAWRRWVDGTGGDIYL